MLKSLLSFLSAEDNKNFARLLSYATQHKARLVYAMLATVGVAGSEALLAMFMQPLIDVGFSSSTAKVSSSAAGAFTHLSQSVWLSPNKVWLVPALLVLMFVVRGACRFVSGYQLSWVAAQVLSELRSKMFGKMLLLPSRYQQQHPGAHVISKFL